MSLTVQVQLVWFKCIVAKSCKIPSSWNKYSVSRSISSAALIFQHCPLQVQWNQLVPCTKQWCGVMMPCRHSQCSLWMGCPKLCVLGEAQFVELTLAGAILKDLASKIHVGSVTCCFMELSAIRLLSPRVVHGVVGDWGFPSLLKSMSHSPVVQAGLKATPRSH